MVSPFAVRHFSIKGARRMHARSMPQDSVELLCAGQLTHLLVQRRERANLARHIGEAIGRLEVFIAAPSPETAIGVDDQRMADTATEYARTIRSGVNLTGPRTFGRQSGHRALDFTDKLLEESSAVTRWRFECLRDRVTQHRVGWRGHDARLKMRVLSHCFDWTYMYLAPWRGCRPATEGWSFENGPCAGNTRFCHAMRCANPGPASPDSGQQPARLPPGPMSYARFGRVRLLPYEPSDLFRGFSMINDLRIAVRNLIRVPGFALAFVLTLGLGIGANTAIFSVINGVLLRPLPYPEADRIMPLRQPQVAAGVEDSSFSFPEVGHYRSVAKTVDQFVEFGDWTFNVLGRGEPHRATGGLV